MFRDPENSFVDAGVEIDADAVIGVACSSWGRSQSAPASRSKAHGRQRLDDRGRRPHPRFSHLEARSSRPGGGRSFRTLAAGRSPGADAHVGNFVELKKTRLGRGAKANHLAYLGDSDIGEASNIGAGTITATTTVVR